MMTSTKGQIGLVLFLLFAQVTGSWLNLHPVERYASIDESLGCDESGTWNELGVIQPSIPGTPAFSRKISARSLQLSRRDCLPNGTNYCFGNNVNYCAGCGVCCADSANRWCCGADGICCGSSCCGKGDSCSEGRCIGSPVTTTVFSTIQSTLTRIATKIDTVIIAVLSTSFIEIVVTVTESKPGATFTDITYVTETVVEKGPEPSSSTTTAPGVAPQSEEGKKQEPIKPLQPGADGLETPSSHESGEPARKAALRRRQEPIRTPASASYSTVTATSVVTEVKEVTFTVSTITTISSISLVTKEVARTRTKEVDAITTLSTTETTTYTSRGPVTATLIVPGTAPAPSVPPVIVTASAPPVTQTTFINPPDATTNPGRTSAPNRGPPLSTGAIAGIAAGSAGFALLAAIAIYVFFLLRARRERKMQEWEDTMSSLSSGGGLIYGGEIRQPRLPTIRQPIPQTRFSPDAFAAAHHSKGRPRRQSAFASTTAAANNPTNNNDAVRLARSATVGAHPSLPNSVTPSAFSVAHHVAELGGTARTEMPTDRGPFRHEVENGHTDQFSSSPTGTLLAPSPLTPDREPSWAPPPRGRGFYYRDY